MRDVIRSHTPPRIPQSRSPSPKRRSPVPVRRRFSPPPRRSCSPDRIQLDRIRAVLESSSSSTEEEEVAIPVPEPRREPIRAPARRGVPARQRSSNPERTSPRFYAPRRMAYVGSSSSTSSTSSEDEEHDRRRSVPFPEVHSINLVPVHPALVNEPYTSNDSGVRPEITKYRPYFKFEVTDHSYPRCRAGNLLLGDKIDTVSQDHSCGGTKNICLVSLVNIYDTYGLEVAYSFLRQLYHSNLSRHNPEWLHFYVAGSLAILHPEYVTKYVADEDESSQMRAVKTSNMCSYLLTELVILDSKLLRLPEPLRPINIQIPEEVLATIICSGQVSKGIRQRYLERKCSEPLREGEMEAVATRPSTSLIDGRYYLLCCPIEDEDSTILAVREWQGIVSGTQFTLRYEVKKNYVKLRRIRATTVTYSVLDYAKAYNLRCSNGKTEVERILTGITSSGVSRHNYEQVCGWIVQLAFESNYEQEAITYDYRETEDLFNKLRVLALENLDTEERAIPEWMINERRRPVGSPIRPRRASPPRARQYR